MEKTIQQEVNGAYGAVQYAWAEVPTEMATTRLEGVTMFQKFGEDIDPDGVFNGSPSLLGTSAQQTAFSGNRTYAAFAMDELGCMSGEGFSFEKPKPAAIAPPGWGLYGNDASGAAPPPAPAQGGGGRWIGTNDSTDFVMKVNGEPQLKLGADGVTEFIGNVKMAQLDAVTPCGPDDDALFRLAVDPGGYLKSIAPCPPPPACIEPVNPWSVPPDGSLENVAICDDFNNVAIGYVNPTHKLHVDGTGYFKDEVGLGEASDDNIRLLVNNMTANQTGIHVHSREINPALTISAYDDDPYFTVMGNGQVKIVGNTAGQTIPSSAIIPMLDISDTDGEAAFQVFNDGKTIVGAGGFSNNPDGARLYLGDDQNYIKSRFGKGISLSTYGAEDALAIEQISGKVNIGGHYGGTQFGLDDYKLSVNGKVLAREFFVTEEYWNTQPWPDFVFEESYDLKTLADLKRFIAKEKHLPEIPSAKDVQTNGIGMAKLDALLLQKIEELTLYLLEVNDKVEALEKENQKLSKELNKLK